MCAVMIEDLMTFVSHLHYYFMVPPPVIFDNLDKFNVEQAKRNHKTIVYTLEEHHEIMMWV